MRSTRISQKLFLKRVRATMADLSGDDAEEWLAVDLGKLNQWVGEFIDKWDGTADPDDVDKAVKVLVDEQALGR